MAPPCLARADGFKIIFPNNFSLALGGRYRPPEVLLESEKYGAPADIWSVGCIFAELLFKGCSNQFRNIWALPGFEGPHNELQQITKIFDICGTPTNESWPNWHKLNGARNCKHKHRESQLVELMKTHCAGITPEELALLQSLLTCNPEKRINAHEALKNQYFWIDPPPAKDEDMPKITDHSHEWQVKKKRQQQKQQQMQQQQQFGGVRPTNPPPAAPGGPPYQALNQHPHPPPVGEPPNKVMRPS